MIVVGSGFGCGLRGGGGFGSGGLVGGDGVKPVDGEGGDDDDYGYDEADHAGGEGTATDVVNASASMG